MFINRITTYLIALCLLCVAACKKKEAPPAPAAISGATNLCPGDSGITYTIAPVAGANYYLWTVPDDAEIIAGQGTTSLVIKFGKHSGKICVKACNENEVSDASCFDITQGGVSGQWCREADFLQGKRSEGVGFSVGGKGYVATGVDETNHRYHDLWEFDPQQNVWTQKADLPAAARFDAFTFAVGNKAYLGTGWDGNNYYSDFWEYDPTQNQWAQKADFAGGSRSYAFAFAIGNKGYAGAGRKPDFTYPADLWEYDPVTDSWTAKTGQLTNGGFVTLGIGNKGYVCFGQNNGVNFWEYDPIADTWASKADFPGAARYSGVAFAIAEKAYVGFGYDGENSYKDFYQYNPQTDTWTQLPDFSGEERGYAVGFAIGNNGYVGLGTDGSIGSVPFQDWWVYGAQ